MEIKKRYNDIILLDDEKKEIGNLSFSIIGDKLIVNRPFIIARLRSKGLGNLLMNGAVELASKNNLKIASTCYYSIKYIENHKEELEKKL